MMQIIFSLLSGLIFGLGLLISGMANPEKVLGFLNLYAPWDPSLALVMAGAITVGGGRFFRRKTPEAGAVWGADFLTRASFCR